jgi:hypothetical protein
MENGMKTKAWDWVRGASPEKIEDEYYCKTRDVFQGRLDTMIAVFLQSGRIPENDVYMLSAIAGEIGNNSFDHNVGNWRDVTGIFFGYEMTENSPIIVLADRGRGIFHTLKRVKPELQNDEEALFTAFNEKISGRAPEPRGNGLKFVKENIKETKKHLSFTSGAAKAELNDGMVLGRSKENIEGCFAIITN